MKKDTNTAKDKKAAEIKAAQASLWATILLPLSLVVVVG